MSLQCSWWTGVTTHEVDHRWERIEAAQRAGPRAQQEDEAKRAIRGSLYEYKSTVHNTHLCMEYVGHREFEQLLKASLYYRD